MKKLMMLMLVVGLAFMVSGATCNQFLCKPTEQQQAQANMGLAIAQQVLNVAASVAPIVAGVPQVSPIAQQVSQYAIPVFEKVRDGYCATQAEWDNAIAKLDDGQKQLVATKALGTAKAANLAVLQTTWGR